MWNRRHRWIRRLVVGFAFAAIAAPAAQAQIESAGSTQATKPGIVRPDDRSARVTPQSGIVRPDDRASRAVPQGQQPKAIELRRNPGAGVESQPVAAAPADGGFSWVDAGAGAGSALVLVLVGLVGRRTLRAAGRGVTVGA
jgi:hypothetical protein